MRRIVSCFTLLLMFASAQREHWHDPAYLRTAVSPQASETSGRRYVSRTPATVPIRPINSDRIPTTVEAWQRYAPGFDVHILKGVNHLDSIWERTDEFDEALISFMEDSGR